MLSKAVVLVFALLVQVDLQELAEQVQPVDVQVTVAKADAGMGSP